MPEWIRMYVLVLLVLELFSELGGIDFEVLYLFVDRYLHTGVNLRLFGLSDILLTIYFLRVDMLLASSSRKDFSFFQSD